MSCECDIPDGGYCQRHDVQKTAHWVMLCRTRPEYFRLWEDNQGPGQLGRNGLGDRIAAGLEAVGVTKKRVSKILRRPCNCGGRQRTLNKLGRKFGIGT